MSKLIKTNIQPIATKRETNIELLRLLATCGVVFLHYNWPTGGGALIHAEPGSINNWILSWLESCAICAVDLFMLISGYFMAVSKKRNLWKVVELIVQVIIFRMVSYFASAFFDGGLSLNGLLTRFLPLNYFVILYCVVYIVSPYIVVLFENMDENNIRRMMLILFVLFSIYPTLVDIVEMITGQPLSVLNSYGRQGDSDGYCTINFMLCWMIGAYIRRRSGSKAVSLKKSIFIYFGITIGILLYMKALTLQGAELVRVLAYCNPLIILEAAVLFISFQKLQIKYYKTINSLAKAGFTVFLLHAQFFKFLNIAEFAQKNPVLLVLHVIISVCGIYFLCYCVFLFYEFLMGNVWKVLKDKISLPQIGVD